MCTDALELDALVYLGGNEGKVNAMKILSTLNVKRIFSLKLKEWLK